MKVTFRTSLGSRDAVALGLDHTQCTIGAKVDVDEKTATALASRGLCEPLPAKPIKAVPKPAPLAKAKLAAIAKEKE